MVTNQTCFVIQPFDDAFTKRFDQVYSIAIEDAGLRPYRVDRDPAVAVPAESIESGIRNATACLADITKDNPNVWLEVGYAMALSKPLIFIASKRRRKLPFDIQHKLVINYSTDAPKDFDLIRIEIAKRIKSRLTVQPESQPTQSPQSNYEPSPF